MNLIPMYDRVLVRKKEYVDPEAKESVIETPDQAKSEPETGVVLAVGEGRILPDGTLRPLSVKPGDFILFGKYAGQDLDWRLLKDHALIREDEILSKIE
jgi:chaperonin GroES